MFIAALVRDKTLLTGYTIGFQVCIYVHSRGDQSIKVSSKFYLGIVHLLQSKVLEGHSGITYLGGQSLHLTYPRQKSVCDLNVIERICPPFFLFFLLACGINILA